MTEKTNLQKDTRQKVLEAATEEFAAKGLAGARVDDIARRAGINKAMIYYHFSSKENLYRAVIGSQMEKIGAVLGSVTDPINDLESALLTLSRLYHQVFGSGSLFSQVLMHEVAAGGIILQEILREKIVRRNLPQKMRAKIAEGIEAGRLRPVDPRHAMISFVGMNLFYLLLTPVVNTILEMEDGEDFRQARPEQIVDLFLHGLKSD